MWYVTYSYANNSMPQFKKKTHVQSGTVFSDRCLRQGLYDTCAMGSVLHEALIALRAVFFKVPKRYVFFCSDVSGRGSYEMAALRSVLHEVRIAHRVVFFPGSQKVHVFVSDV